MKSNRMARKAVAARINPISIAVASAVGSLAVIAEPVLAADSTGFFDEMVVSATRRDTDIQDVPYNIAAFSGETLQNQRISNLGQFARWVPGLTLTDQGNRSANVLTVRGLNASSIQAAEFLDNSGGDTVSTYVGDVPLYIDLKPYDLERVETLIGPQGTLYGAGTLAGAVRYIPNKPRTDELTVDAHAKTYFMSESDDIGYGGDVTVNVPLVDDVLAFRGTLGYVMEAGYIDYDFLVREPGVSNPEPDFTNPADVAANLTSEEDVNDEETLNFRGALLWNITDELEAILTVHYQDMEVGGRNINHAASFGTSEYVSGMRYTEPEERENTLVSLEINWDLGFANLTSATGVSNYDEDGRRDQTDLLLNFEYGYEDFPAFAAFTRDTNEEDTVTQEIRLVSQGEGPFNWIVGAFYSDWESDALSLEFTPGIPEFFGIAPPPLPTGDIEFRQITLEEEEQFAVFGEAGVQLGERFEATVGLRWFDYENTLNVTVDLPLIDVFGVPDIVKADDNDITTKVNLSVNLDDTIPGMQTGNAYATFSEGYRLGGGNAFAACTIPLPPGQNVCLLPDEVSYDVDTTTNIEFGIKSDWFDGDLMVNAAVFWVEWDDVQLQSTSINGDVPITVNAGEAQSIGAELASRWQISENWAAFGSYAYTEAELTENSPNVVGIRSAPPNADAFDGDRLPGTPEHQGSLNINYSQPIAGDLTLDVDYGFTAISDVYTKTGLRGSGEALGGFTVHNAAVKISSDQWSVSLYSDNLTDKFARTGVRSDPDFIDTIGVNNFTLRRYYHNVIRPRTIGLDFRYNFDF